MRYDRGRAAVALGMLDAHDYSRALAELLTSANAYDRAGAALGLALMGAREQEPAIRGLLDDDDSDVRDAAKNALKELTQRDGSPPAPP